MFADIGAGEQDAKVGFAARVVVGQFALQRSVTADRHHRGVFVNRVGQQIGLGQRDQVRLGIFSTGEQGVVGRGLVRGVLGFEGRQPQRRTIGPKRTEHPHVSPCPHVLRNPTALENIDLVAQVTGVQGRLQADRARSQNRDSRRSLHGHAGFCFGRQGRLLQITYFNPAIQRGVAWRRGRLNSAGGVSPLSPLAASWSSPT